MGSNGPAAELPSRTSGADFTALERLYLGWIFKEELLVYTPGPGATATTTLRALDLGHAGMPLGLYLAVAIPCGEIETLNTLDPGGYTGSGPGYVVLSYRGYPNDGLGAHDDFYSGWQLTPLTMTNQARACPSSCALPPPRQALCHFCSWQLMPLMMANQARPANRSASPLLAQPTDPREAINQPPAPTPARPTPAKQTSAPPTLAKLTPAKQTPAQPTPAQPTPAQPTPDQPTPAKRTPARPTPAPPTSNDSRRVGAPRPPRPRPQVHM